MLSYRQVAELERELRDELALSVYIDGTVHDPAARYVWRRKLEHGLQEIRHRLQGSDRRERDAFEAAARAVEAELGAYAASLPAPGWVGFATGNGLHRASEVPVPMPDLVWWGRGIRIAPYVRALGEECPVIAVLVDSRRARLFRYRCGTLEDLADLRADTFLGDLSDAHVSKRGTRHSGIRGTTATDEADRQLQVELDRMLRALSVRLDELWEANGSILFGGTPEAVRAAEERLPERLRSRVRQQPSLGLEASPAELRNAVEEAARAVREMEQAERVGAVIDAARGNGKGVLGVEPTLRALEQRSVDRLFLTPAFIAGCPHKAELAVKGAFGQDAYMEEVSGPAAQRLDAEAEGIGARLRFVVRQVAS